VGRSTIRPRPESASFPASRARVGRRSRDIGGQEPSRPNRDVRNTIEARRRAESVDNHRDNRSCHHDDRGRGRRHDSGADCDNSLSPNQRGQRAFGQSIRDVKFPSRFRAPMNVPRYNGDTKPSV
jgi:hypothetical protein